MLSLQARPLVTSSAYSDKNPQIKVGSTFITGVMIFIASFQYSSFQTSKRFLNTYTLVRESIAYPYMDSKIPQLSIWISVFFRCQFSIIYASVAIHIDI